MQFKHFYRGTLALLLLATMNSKASGGDRGRWMNQQAMDQLQQPQPTRLSWVVNGFLNLAGIGRGHQHTPQPTPPVPAHRNQTESANSASSRAASTAATSPANIVGTSSTVTSSSSISTSSTSSSSSSSSATPRTPPLSPSSSTMTPRFYSSPDTPSSVGLKSSNEQVSSSAHHSSSSSSSTPSPVSTSTSSTSTTFSSFPASSDTHASSAPTSLTLVETLASSRPLPSPTNSPVLSSAAFSDIPPNLDLSRDAAASSSAHHSTSSSSSTPSPVSTSTSSTSTNFGSSSASSDTQTMSANCSSSSSLAPHPYSHVSDGIKNRVVHFDTLATNSSTTSASTFSSTRSDHQPHLVKNLIDIFQRNQATSTTASTTTNGSSSSTLPGETPPADPSASSPQASSPSSPEIMPASHSDSATPTHQASTPKPNDAAPSSATSSSTTTSSASSSSSSASSNSSTHRPPPAVQGKYSRLDPSSDNLSERGYPMDHAAPIHPPAETPATSSSTTTSSTSASASASNSSNPLSANSAATVGAAVTLSREKNLLGLLGIAAAGGFAPNVLMHCGMKKENAKKAALALATLTGLGFQVWTGHTGSIDILAALLTSVCGSVVTMEVVQAEEPEHPLIAETASSWKKNMADKASTIKMPEYFQAKLAAIKKAQADVDTGNKKTGTEKSFQEKTKDMWAWVTNKAKWPFTPPPAQATNCVKN